MADTPSLEDLMTVPSQDDVMAQEIVPALQGRGSRITDWLANAVYRTMAFVVGKLRTNVRLAVATLAAAGFEDYVFALVDVPNNIDVTDWAPIVAKQRYGLEQILASYTRRRITLANATATPYPVNPGDLTIEFPSGNRYVLDEAGTIAASGDTQLVFRSEFASDSVNGISYNGDLSGAAIVLVTSNFPGVTASNPPTSYSDVAQSGSGVGTVTPSGTPTGGTHAVIVRIDATGTVADATVQWSTNVGGAGWVTQSGSSASNLGGFGIDVTLSDNGGDPAFVEGANYYFSTPGSDVTEVGRDIETPPELGARCRGLLPMFNAVKDGAGNFIPISPTPSGYEFLARTASNQVKVVFVENDPNVNNKVNIYVAGQGAPLDGPAIAAVQNYLDTWHMITDLPLAQSVTPREVNLGGASVVVVVRKGQKAAAQASLQRALQLYFGGVDQANVLSVNGLIEHAYIVSLVRKTAGVKRMENDEAMTIGHDGGSFVADDLQLPVTPGAHELAQWNQAISGVWTWREE